jgi:hypothetical protein
MDQGIAPHAAWQDIRRFIARIEEWAAPRIASWRSAKAALQDVGKLAVMPTEEGFAAFVEELRRRGLAPAIASWECTAAELWDPRSRPWAFFRAALRAAIEGDYPGAVELVNAIDPPERPALAELAPLRILNMWFVTSCVEAWTCALLDLFPAGAPAADLAQQARGSGLLTPDAAFMLDAIIARLSQAHSVDKSLAPPAVSIAPQPTKTVRPKRSTQPGEADEKLVAALLMHHQYENGSCLSYSPVGCSNLARIAGVSKGSASLFLRRRFGSHAAYQRTCRDKWRLINTLRTLAGDMPRERALGGRDKDVAIDAE